MKVAVVGSGVSGLGSTWLLNEYSEHDVHLYEADTRPGGHANTVWFQRKGTGERVEVDTGFIVLNPTTYPNFLRFLKLAGVPVKDTHMTFSVSRDRGAFEWAGTSLSAVFCQAKNFWRADMWRMIWDVLRFNACARKLLLDDVDEKMSIGEYLEREGFSDAFIDDYLIPMTAAIWSTPPDTCAVDFPAKSLLRFMHNHHLLQLTGKPAWLTIPGGSHVYVNKILSNLPTASLHLNSPVHAVSTSSGRSTILLTTEDGHQEMYDHVILACHSDTALSILENGTGMSTREKDILGGFAWSKNEAVLHSDVALMPRSRAAWACWNYLTESVNDSGRVKANRNKVALTYLMNDLQHISETTFGPVLVTLNPPFEPRSETIVGRYRYDHPVFSAQTVRSQRLISTIQNVRHITYAGAYLGYGFHEDGFTSGLRAVVDHLPGVQPPFSIRGPDRELPAMWVATLFQVMELMRVYLFVPLWVLLARILGYKSEKVCSLKVE